MHNPILVALDLPSQKQALDLARSVAPHVGGVKVGKELFVTAGPEVVERLMDLGLDVFLDLKFHDIPNTVAKAVAAATRLGVRMLTVHTCGGNSMLGAAAEAADKTAQECGQVPPLMLGVTVLTSLDDAALEEVGVPQSVELQVRRLALLGAQAGLGGLVCSPLELSMLKAILPPSIQLVTPGIRGIDSPQDDQRRTLSPREAIREGANWLVIGRPIYAAKDPREAASAIWQDLQN